MRGAGGPRTDEGAGGRDVERRGGTADGRRLGEPASPRDPSALHTTTVRFDAETWTAVVATCDRLSIAQAEYIRGAVQRRLGLATPALGAGPSPERLGELEETVTRLAQRVDAVARVLRHVTDALPVAPSQRRAAVRGP